MAHSLELRVPLLDIELMHTAEQIPTKYLLMSIIQSMLSAKQLVVIYQEEWSNRKKLGFPVPIKDWLREEKYYKVVRQLFEQDFVAEFFDQEKLLKMLDDNFADKNDARRKLWTIYSFLTCMMFYFINNG